MENKFTPAINLKARYVISMIVFWCQIAMIALSVGIICCALAPKTDRTWMKVSGIFFLILLPVWIINACVMVANQVNCKVLCDKIKYSKTRLILISALYNSLSFIVLILIDVWSNNWSDKYWLLILLLVIEIGMWTFVLVHQWMLSRIIKKQLN